MKKKENEVIIVNDVAKMLIEKAMPGEMVFQTMKEHTEEQYMLNLLGQLVNNFLLNIEQNDKDLYNQFVIIQKETDEEDVLEIIMNNLELCISWSQFLFMQFF